MTKSSAPRKKPITLRRKRIMRKTGAKSQAKQISALSTQVSKLTRRSWATCATRWQRDNLTCDTVAGSGYAYIAPIPYAPGNPAGSNTGNAPTPFTDNLSLAAQPTFTKEIIFGIAAEAQNSNEVYHTGGTIKWQMMSTEPSFGKYTLALVKPKKALADQLVKDRLLKQGSTLNPTLGFAGFLNNGLDYVCHSGTGLSTATGTFFGATINSKYWTTLYKKELTFSHPNGTSITSNVSANNSSPANNAITHRGTIRLPPGGMCKNAGTSSQTGTRPEATGWELEYGDQSNEEGCYLICINNGVNLDNETTTLGYMVCDYYKAAV